jgi:hypothetical protein
MATTEVVILLDGNEVPRCEECCAPMFSLHSRYYADETHYCERFEMECARGHTRTVVSPFTPLTDEMRELLS